MIDYHCHLLPGLDDGPKTVEEAVVMARAMAGFGFSEICCTPHCIKGHYEHAPKAVRAAVASLQGALDRAGIKLKLHPGMEYYLDSCFDQFIDDLLPLAASRLVLCEAPPQVYPEMVVELLGLIVARGYVPLVAHPERSDVVWTLLEVAEEGDNADQAEKGGARAKGSLLGGWLGRGRPMVERVAIPGSRELPDETLFQANLGSFIGYYGPQPQLRAYQLLKRGVYSCLASDLHEARSAEEFLQSANDKVMANPVLHKVLTSTDFPPKGVGEEGKVNQFDARCR